ncbi:MAG: hypothetical protein AAGB00_06290 [Planctomycetota bacterium]
MLLTAHEIADEFRVDIRTLYGWAKGGIFPTPIIVRRRMLWEREDIALYKEWLKRRVEARRAGRDPNAVERPNYSGGPTPLTKPERDAQATTSEA